jgi:hypothetical protein
MTPSKFPLASHLSESGLAVRNVQTEQRILNPLQRHAEGVVASSLTGWRLASPGQPHRVRVACYLGLYRRSAGLAIPLRTLALRVRGGEDQVLARLADRAQPVIEDGEMFRLSGYMAAFVVPGLLRVGLIGSVFQGARVFLRRFPGQAGLLPLWSALAFGPPPSWARLDFGGRHPYTVEVTQTLRTLELRDDTHVTAVLASALGFAAFTADCLGRTGKTIRTLGCNLSPLINVLKETERYLAGVTRNR